MIDCVKHSRATQKRQVVSTYLREAVFPHMLGNTNTWWLIDLPDRDPPRSSRKSAHSSAHFFLPVQSRGYAWNVAPPRSFDNFLLRALCLFFGTEVKVPSSQPSKNCDFPKTLFNNERLYRGRTTNEKMRINNHKDAAGSVTACLLFLDALYVTVDRVSKSRTKVTSVIGSQRGRVRVSAIVRALYET